ncbi:MAG: hypothetical protein HGA54_03965, partial [Actinobacteria bacterium]|nr:hypothetical protein [Actinomycetota bacterium]
MRRKTAKNVGKVVAVLVSILLVLPMSYLPAFGEVISEGAPVTSTIVTEPESLPVETPLISEEPMAVEEPTPIAAPTIVEEPAVEPSPVIEEPVAVETPPVIEEPAVVETPAVVLTQVVNGTIITVSIPEGIAPVGTQLVATEITDEVVGTVEDTLADDATVIDKILAYDIKLIFDGRELTWDEGVVVVTFTGAEIALANANSSEVEVYHFNGTEFVPMSATEANTTISFDAAHFSKYVYVGTSEIQAAGILPMSLYTYTPDPAYTFVSAQINEDSTNDHTQLRYIWVENGLIHMAVASTHMLDIANTKVNGISPTGSEVSDPGSAIVLGPNTLFPTGLQGNINGSHWTVLMYPLSTVNLYGTNSIYVASQQGLGHELGGTIGFLIPKIPIHVDKSWTPAGLSDSSVFVLNGITAGGAHIKIADFTLTTASPDVTIQAPIMTNLGVPYVDYEVIETPNPAWVQSYYNHTGNMTTGFTFTIGNTASAGTLIVDKTLTGVTAAQLASLTFNVTGPAGFTPVTQVFVPVPGAGQLDLDDLIAGGTWSLGSVPTGSYTITETAVDITGYTRTTSWTVNAGGSTSSLVATASVAPATTTTVVFTNAYSRDLGGLIVTKALSCDAIALGLIGTIAFDVTGPSGFTPTGKTFYRVPGAGQTSIATLLASGWDLGDVPTGAYVVTETITDLTGYTRTTSWTTTNPGGGSGTDLTAEAIVAKAADTTVAFTNTYVRDLGSLVIGKTLTGVTAAQLASLTFNVTGPSGFTPTSMTFVPTPGAGQMDLDDLIGGGSGRWHLSPVPTGSYTITETAVDITGYTRTTSWTVNAGGSTTSLIASATVAKATTTTVVFTNAYVRDTGTLIVDKTL